jgi:8-oxo-dGTP pyrophosphatase MutT (NUDIX family)
MTAVPIGIDPTPLISSAAGVLLFYGDLVLLARRITEDSEGVKPSFGGYWSPFAGAIENGESSREAAARELWEESGKKVPIEHLIHMGEVQREKGSFILYAYKLEDLFVPTLDGEHTEYGYFKINTLHASPNPTCPKVVEMAQDFHASSRHSG